MEDNRSSNEARRKILTTETPYFNHCHLIANLPFTEFVQMKLAVELELMS